MADVHETPTCERCVARLQSVFRDVDSDTIESMAAVKACTVYKKGQIIFEQGDRPHGLYCMHSGKVKVYKIGDEGRQKIVRFAKSGDVLGYRSLVSGEPYSLSASALEDSTVCCIPQETFFEMMKEGDFSKRLMQLLAGDLRKAEEQLVNMAQKPVRERLAEALLILKEVYGTENGDNTPINVTLSRDELASLVGTATETLVRTIADLKRESLIATEKKKIRILNLEGLIRVGNLQD